MPKDRTSLGWLVAKLVEWDVRKKPSAEICGPLGVRHHALSDLINGATSSHHRSGGAVQNQFFSTAWIRKKLLPHLPEFSPARWEKYGPRFLEMLDTRGSGTKAPRKNEGFGHAFGKVLRWEFEPAKDIAAHMGVSYSRLSAYVHERVDRNGNIDRPSQQWVLQHWDRISTFHAPTWEQHAIEFAKQCNQLSYKRGKGTKSGSIDFVALVEKGVRQPAELSLIANSRKMPEDENSLGWVIAMLAEWDIKERSAEEICGQIGIDKYIFSRLIHEKTCLREKKSGNIKVLQLHSTEWIRTHLQSRLMEFSPTRWQTYGPRFLEMLDIRVSGNKALRKERGFGQSFGKVLRWEFEPVKEIAAHVGVPQNVLSDYIQEHEDQNGNIIRPSQQWVLRHWNRISTLHAPTWEEHAPEFAVNCNQLNHQGGGNPMPSGIRFNVLMENGFRKTAAPILLELADNRPFRIPILQNNARRVFAGDETLSFNIFGSAATEIVKRWDEEKGLENIPRDHLACLNRLFVPVRRFCMDREYCA